MKENINKMRRELMQRVKQAPDQEIISLANMLGVPHYRFDSDKVDIVELPNGFIIDGLSLLSKKCNCGSTISHCFYTWNRVYHEDALEYGDIYSYKGNATSEFTSGDYKWGYEVEKGYTTVKVEMQDTHSNTVFAGEPAPTLDEWVERGWRVLSSFNEDDGEYE